MYKFLLTSRIKITGLSVVILVVILLLGVYFPGVAQAQKKGYSFSFFCDEVYTSWGEPFRPFDSDHPIVYALVTGLPDVTYKCAYYDDGDDLKCVDGNLIIDGSSYLWSQYDLRTDDQASAGNWMAAVYEQSAEVPSSYDSNDDNIVADNGFNVAKSAIPEIPTVMAGIGVAGLCFGIYYWMRRKAFKNQMITT